MMPKQIFRSITMRIKNSVEIVYGELITIATAITTLIKIKITITKIWEI